MKIENWKFEHSPRLNGKTITLLPDELSRIYAIRLDSRGFVLGARVLRGPSTYPATVGW